MDSSIISKIGVSYVNYFKMQNNFLQTLQKSRTKQIILDCCCYYYFISISHGKFFVISEHLKILKCKYVKYVSRNIYCSSTNSPQTTIVIGTKNSIAKRCSYKAKYLQGHFQCYYPVMWLCQLTMLIPIAVISQNLYST